ncbi:MAG: hypothetical protein M0R73_01380 [Dehalococcoidia bacterium]|nr:hypothetical protein [Dehalococcoidia bacterium]
MAVANWGTARRSPPSARERLMTLLDLFSELRLEARIAGSRDELAELHRRAGYLVGLATVVALQPGEQWVDPAALPTVANREFARTVDTLNRRGREIGIALNLAPRWNGER